MLEALLTWDEGVFRIINAGWVHPLLDRLMSSVTDARHYQLPFIVGAILILCVGRIRGLRFLVLAVVSVVVADAIANHIFKQVFLRARPCIVLEGVRLLVGCINSPSFPSNHAVNAGALATLVGLYMPRLWLPAAALAVLVGYSRIYVGAHYPLDVLAGSVLGIVVAMVFSRGMTLLWPFRTRPDAGRRIVSLKIGEN
jgi:undecaprenyl-diphosphatase